MSFVFSLFFILLSMFRLNTSANERTMHAAYHPPNPLHPPLHQPIVDSLSSNDLAHLTQSVSSKTGGSNHQFINNSNNKTAQKLPGGGAVIRNLSQSVKNSSSLDPPPPPGNVLLSHQSQGKLSSSLDNKHPAGPISQTKSKPKDKAR